MTSRESMQARLYRSSVSPGRRWYSARARSSVSNASSRRPSSCSAVPRKPTHWASCLRKKMLSGWSATSRSSSSRAGPGTGSPRPRRPRLPEDPADRLAMGGDHVPIVGVRRGFGGQLLVDLQGPPLGVEGLRQAARGGEVGAEIREDLGQPRPVLGVPGVVGGQALEELSGPPQVAQRVVNDGPTPARGRRAA